MFSVFSGERNCGFQVELPIASDSSGGREGGGFGTLSLDAPVPRACESLSQRAGGCILPSMSTVQEIEAAIPRLSRTELKELRAWFEEYLEDQLELSDEVKAKLDESRQEIAAGHYTTRQPD